DILHGGHEGSVGVWRDHPLVVQVRLGSVFLSVRPMVLSLAPATMFSSTTLLSPICSVHRAKPSAGVEHARPISFASLAPSQRRRLAECGERCGVSTPSTPSSTSCRRTRATVIGLVCKPPAIWQSVNASPASEASAFSRMRARISLRAECLPVRISACRRSRSSALSVTTYLLTAACLVDTESILPQPRAHRFEGTDHCQ